LDHWALRLFSDDVKLQDRFVSTFIRKKGTLLLSTFSFAEFARNDDRRNSVAAKEFIERLLPNIYLSDTAIDSLVKLERNEPNNIGRFSPPSDLPQLKLFASRAQDAPLGFTMKGFITLARDNYHILEAFTKETVHKIRSSIELQRSDPVYVRKARVSRPSPDRTRTFIIMGELMREFVLDASLEISDNDIMDMLHAIVSVNCCDYVLLDGAWESRVTKMCKRIEKSGHPMPVAKCFSFRKNGIARFLDDLEAYSNA